MLKPGNNLLVLTWTPEGGMRVNVRRSIEKLNWAFRNGEITKGDWEGGKAKVRELAAEIGEFKEGAEAA